VLDDWCARSGRNPGEIERSAGLRGGDPETDGQAYYDVGTRLITISVSGPDFDMGRVSDWVQWRDEVNAQ
jgi:hypothetical protein